MNKNKDRYKLIIEFKGNSTPWETNHKTTKDVSIISSAIDDSVLSAKIIDNITGKTIQKLR